MKAYIACSFAFPDKKASEQRKAIIEVAAQVLKEKGFNVFVPHQHKIPGGENMNNYEWSMRVRSMDMEALEQANWVVLLTFGKAGNNAGVAWEAGYAFGLKKNLLIVKMNNEIESCMMFPNSHAQVWGIEGLTNFNFSDESSWERIRNITMS